MNPLVSIIIPESDNNTYLVRCLNSIARQTWPEIEVLLIEQANKKISFQKDCTGLIDSLSLRISDSLKSALENAAGEYVFCCSRTSYMTPNTINELIENLCHTENDENTIAAASIYAPDDINYRRYEFGELSSYGKLIKTDLVNRCRESVHIKSQSPDSESIFLAAISAKQVMFFREAQVYESDEQVLKKELTCFVGNHDVSAILYQASSNCIIKILDYWMQKTNDLELANTKLNAEKKELEKGFFASGNYKTYASDSELTGITLAEHIVQCFADGKLGAKTILCSFFAWIRFKFRGQRKG